MELNGELIKIMDIQSFESGFSKRAFVIKTSEDQYPQEIKLEFYKDKCALLDAFEIGQQVKVDFNIRGNEYNGNYYVNLNAWRIQNAGDSSSASGITSQYQPNISDAPNQDDSSADDLPF